MSSNQENQDVEMVSDSEKSADHTSDEEIIEIEKKMIRLHVSNKYEDTLPGVSSSVSCTEESNAHAPVVTGHVNYKRKRPTENDEKDDEKGHVSYKRKRPTENDEKDDEKKSSKVHERQKETYIEPHLNPGKSQSLLTKQDQDRIQKGMKLNDTIMTTIQKVVRLQNIGGLGNVPLCSTSSPADVDNCMQIHHTGKDHWVCSSLKRGRVRVFDSSPQKMLTESMKHQLAQCYPSLVRDQKLFVHLPATQIQEGPVECGPFASAFLVDLAYGNEPSTITYDEGKMRQHLHTCLERQFFTPFPRQTTPTRFSDDFSQTIDLG